MAAAKKIIAIVGASGIQGSSVAKAFLDAPKWHVRCLTRSPDSEKAQTLASQGAEIVSADLNDPTSLKRAFTGVHAIFLNTEFATTYGRAVAEGKDQETSCKIGYDAEIAMGKNAIDAAAGVETLERLVYSALGPMKAASAGKYSHSNHWETKAFLVNYIETQHTELNRKTSFIYIGAYITNQLLRPQPQQDTGEYVVFLPAGKQTPLPVIDTAHSSGLFVKALVEEEDPGTKLLAYDEYLTFESFMNLWSKVTGKEAKFVQLSVQEMHVKTGLPLEFLDAPAFMEEFAYCAGLQNVIEPAQLKSRVGVRTVEDSLRRMEPAFLLGENN